MSSAIWIYSHKYYLLLLTLIPNGSQSVLVSHIRQKDIHITSNIFYRNHYHTLAKNHVQNPPATRRVVNIALIQLALGRYFFVKDHESGLALLWRASFRSSAELDTLGSQVSGYSCRAPSLTTPASFGRLQS